jgi:Phosphotriesterase family
MQWLRPQRNRLSGPHSPFRKAAGAYRRTGQIRSPSGPADALDPAPRALTVAHDAACFIDWFSEEAKAATVPNWNFTHNSDDVLPALRECGVTDDQITTMLVDNPRRYFQAVK